MPYSPLQHLPAELIDRAARIRLACFDVDGTLTDGRLYYDHAGNESKAFNVLDGQGLKQLEHAGIHVALITARASLSAEKRGQDLGLQQRWLGAVHGHLVNDALPGLLAGPGHQGEHLPAQAGANASGVVLEQAGQQELQLGYVSGKLIQVGFQRNRIAGVGTLMNG